jgi:hypothetical protein
MTAKVVAPLYVVAVAAGIVVFLLNNVMLARVVTRLPGGTALSVTIMAAVALVALATRRFGSITLIYGTYGLLGLVGHLGVDATTYVRHLPALLLAAAAFDVVVALGRYRWPALLVGVVPFGLIVMWTRTVKPDVATSAGAFAVAWAGLGAGILLHALAAADRRRQRLDARP